MSDVPEILQFDFPVTFASIPDGALAFVVPPDRVRNWDKCRVEQFFLMSDQPPEALWTALRHRILAEKALYPEGAVFVAYRGSLLNVGKNPSNGKNFLLVSVTCAPQSWEIRTLPAKVEQSKLSKGNTVITPPDPKQEPDPRTPEEVRKAIRKLRETADEHNLLWNDNVDRKLNLDLRDFHNRLAEYGEKLLAEAEAKL